MNKEKLENAKNLFFIAIGIDIAVTALVVVSDIWGVGILKDIGAGRITADQTTISTLEFWNSFSMLMFLTMLGVGLGLVKWLNSCYSYAKESIGASGFKNEGWTTGGWIIPIFNMFKPYQVINEIYKAGSLTYALPDGWKKKSGSSLLLAWWIFWAVAHVIGWIVGKQIFRSAMRDDMTLQQSIGVIEFHALFCVVSLIVSGLWLVVASSLTRRLLDRQNAGIASPISVRLETMSQPVIPTRLVTPSLIPKARDVGMESFGEANQHQAQTQTSPSDYVDMDEDAIYAVVAEELESGKTDKGLWARLFVECDGDEKQVKVLYIKRRAEKLKVVESTRREQVAIQKAELRRVEAIAEEKAEELRRRNAGLAEPELVAAVWGGNWATASKLLSEGISPFGSDANGASLLDLAIRRGDRQMVDLLKSYGAGIAVS